MVHWTIGPLVRWSIGPLVECRMLNVIKVKLLSERTSGVPPVIFNHDIIGTGFNRHLKAGQKQQFVTQKKKENG